MPKTQLSDYIKLYDKTLSPEHCNTLIERFEASAAQHERRERNVGKIENMYNFSELNVSLQWPDAEGHIAQVFRAALLRYRDSLEVKRFWPSNPMSEAIRMKRYLPNGREMFSPHVDVLDQANSRRFVTAIIYLNVPGGGETIFPDLGVAIPPEPGRLVIFPPLWTFVHAGRPPLERPKYILHSYLWYPSVAPLETAAAAG